MRKTLFTCFRKIRIKSNNNRKINSYISNLLDERKAAILKKDFQKRETIEIKIKSYEHDQNISIVNKNIKQLKDKSRKGFWNLKAK